MRKIEEAMCAAVSARENWKEGNTQVENFGSEVTVSLHGSPIYRIVDGCRYFTLAGWNTMTTRRRLNALGVNVHNVGGIPMYNGVAIDKYNWYAI